MKSTTGHIVGATYRSQYWGQTYTVLKEAVTRIGSQGVTVAWEDGRTTTHSTHVGNDPLIEEPSPV